MPLYLRLRLLRSRSLCACGAAHLSVIDAARISLRDDYGDYSRALFDAQFRFPITRMPSSSRAIGIVSWRLSRCSFTAAASGAPRRVVRRLGRMPLGSAGMITGATASARHHDVYRVQYYFRPRSLQLRFRFLIREIIALTLQLPPSPCFIAESLGGLSRLCIRRRHDLSRDALGRGGNRGGCFDAVAA